MNKKLLILLFVGFCLNIEAQFVTIPDANFVTWLQTNIPSAMSGNQMDTTSSAVTTCHSINVSGQLIADITGVQYFDSLTHLDCSVNHLTNLPVLPSTLQYLDCSVDSITSLPALPNSLQELICYSNYLQSLPTLPTSLQGLSCGYNNISCFPSFPSSITRVILSPNPFNCLPNYTAGMDSATLSMPLCAAGNSNGCAISTSCAPGISFFLSKDASIPNTWDGYPSYSYQVTTATWYWGDGISTIGLYPNHTYASGGQYYICVTAFSSCGDSANYCYSDSLWRTTSNMVNINMINNSTTGISQNTNSFRQFSIYPNPTTNQFFIEANTNEKLTMDLYDVNGRYVLNKIVNNKSAIDVSDLNEGIYTVKIKTAEGIQNKKLVIVR